MNGYNYWSYHPYKPLLTDIGDIYISRIAPDYSKIHFEWLENGDEYSIYYKKRDDEKFILAGTTKKLEYDILNLEPETDYEFYVESDNKKSRTRIARTGKVIGTVVNYLHPDDEAYSFSGRCLCSPSLVRHPEGYLLASMDVFGHSHPQNLTLIFRSDDEGKTWHHVSELMPSFWGKMFIHKGDLYMLSCSTEYGDLLIGKSTDGGKTFSAPVCLLRGSNGKNGNTGIHKNPQNVFIHNGRIYETLEWGSWQNQEFCHSAMVMSCSVDDDLLTPENWIFTEPLKFGHFAPELKDLPLNTMTIEGTITLSPEGKLLNIMRFGKRGYAIKYEIDTKNHGDKLTYDGLMSFNANLSKFMIKYDAISKSYYSIATRLYEGSPDYARNLLSLMKSSDLKNWEVICDLFDYRDSDVEKVGFQYVDFEFEGDDIIYLCRTALNNATSYHDTNYSTFHKIENFRKIN